MGSERTEPAEIERLKRRIAELEADQLADSRNSGAVQGDGDASGKRAVKDRGSKGPNRNTGKRTKIATGGGSVIRGSVKTHGGHFIGRDFIQIVTEVVHKGDDPDEAQSVIAHYLAALAIDLAGLKLNAIDPSAAQTGKDLLQLTDIYVPLNTQLRIPAKATLAQWLARAPRVERGDIDAQRETRAVSALEALAAHRELTLLGKPGSGKSTFGASVLLTLAQVWQGHRDELAKLEQTWTHGPLLPIRVILRRFAAALPSGGQAVRAGHLWDFIAQDLKDAGHGLSTKTMEYVQRIARNHGALILLDGLDECGSTATRARVLAAVKELKRTAGNKCRFILTARPYAWPGGPDAAKGVYALADFGDEQVEQFIHAWYAALVARNWRTPGEAKRKRDELLQTWRRADLEPLTRNPLLLTLTTTLHTNRGRLPEDRADLYHESVELLMLHWNRQIDADKALIDELAIPGLKLSDLREVLEELAFQVHKDSFGKDGGGPADVGEDRLIRAFRPLLNDSRDKAAVVVEYIEKRAGLLIGQGEKDGERQFTFPHRTFQEFLAASHLAVQDDFPAECVRLAESSPGHWQVVLALAARIAKAERGASAADELIGSKSIEDFSKEGQAREANWAHALLAGLQLQEIGASALRKRPRTSQIVTRVTGWLEASLPVHPDEGGLPARTRAQAGDILAALGDPRFDPERFHLPVDHNLGFVCIPADASFRIGTRHADAPRIAKIIGSEIPDDEINDAVTPTPEFYIARYPITVGQFRAFVAASGFAPGDDDALRDLDNRPVRWVSWHEALAYCDWLDEMLKTSRQLADNKIARLVREDGWCLTLPSQLEWEKAARGAQPDAIYSWGDTPDPNRANYDETEIGDTSTVGSFPANSFGLSDMIGNVWEWTRSLWGRDSRKPDFGYLYDPTNRRRENLRADDEIGRVLRGGAWLSPRGCLRCAYRNRDRPGDRSGNLGFRVVLRSAPVS